MGQREKQKQSLLMLMCLTAIIGHVKKAWHFKGVLLRASIVNNV